MESSLYGVEQSSPHELIFSVELQSMFIYHGTVLFQYLATPTFPKNILIGLIK